MSHKYKNTGFAALLVCAICSILLWACTLYWPTPFLYSDGDTASWIWLSRHHIDIYRLSHGVSMLATNYPPYYIWLVSWLAPEDSAILRTGGILSLCGFLLAVFSVGLSAFRITQSKQSGFIAGLLLAGAIPASYYATGCVPDCMALGICTLGVTIATRRIPFWPFICGILFSIALMIKHSIIVFPVSVCIWSLARHTKRGIILMLTMVLFLVYPLVRLNLLAPLFLWSAADWSLANFLLKVIQWVLPWVVGIFLTANLIVKLQVFDAKARQELEPWIVSFFSSMVWIFALGRTGSSSNYTLELLSTLAVCVAVANHKFERHFLFNLHIVVMLIYCIIMSTAYIVNTIPQTRRELDIVRSTITKSMDGPVLSEYTWHTTVLQRPPLIIPFLSHQLARKKLWDPSPLVDQLAHKTIRWIILGFPLSSQPKFGHSDRWLPVILDTARANYKLAVSQDDLYIYEPL